MTEAYHIDLKDNIDLKEASEFNSPLTHKLLCENPQCRARLKYVPSYLKGEEPNIIFVSDYFGLVSSDKGNDEDGDASDWKNAPKNHVDSCRYNTIGQVKIIARESEGLIQSISAEGYEFRLHLLSKALNNISSISSDIFEGDLTSNKIGTVYKRDTGKLSAYLSTAKKILILRSEMDEHEDLSKHVIISYNGKKIYWSNFYFETEDYSKCFYRLQNHQHPVCTYGEVKKIFPPDGNVRFTKVQLKALTESQNDEQIITVVRLYVKNAQWIDGLGENMKVLAFGFMKTKENYVKEKNITWLNIEVRIDQKKQIHFFS